MKPVFTLRLGASGKVLQENRSTTDKTATIINKWAEFRAKLPKKVAK
jgi:hypothetical protein